MTTHPIAGYRKLFALVTLPLFVLDQLTKWAVFFTIKPEEGLVPVIPGFFYLVHWYNTGAAFSVFSDSNWFFIGLSLVALCVIIVMARRNLFADRSSRLGWALLFSGILGNVTDRFVHGAVLDFLLFDLHVRFANPWPAFNVADSCICVAAFLFLWQSFRDGKKAKPEADGAGVPSANR
ncbi:MAG TPA: signal peptidase II [Chthoniobacteraceae bacterium]|nr:signal peptidase II [Chthoniobacteraceae bacterium]